MNFGATTIFSKGQPTIMGMCAFSPERCGVFVLLADGNRVHLKMVFCPAQNNHDAATNPEHNTSHIVHGTIFNPNDVHAYQSVTEVREGAEPQETSFVYDANGNLTQDALHTYVYDYRNLLVAARDRTTGDLVATYQYDALGRRISKAVGDVTIDYIYDGLNIIEERISDEVRAFVHGAGLDDPVAMIRGDEVHFYHTDPSGNIVALTNSAGELAERYTYIAYGEVEIHDASGALLEESAAGNPFLYTGREYDSETGLYHYRLRTYHPSLGRFLQKDPLGYIDSLNQYAYVVNNPINFIDPMGLETRGASGNARAGNPGFNINNPLNSPFLNYVDRNFAGREGNDGFFDSVAATLVRPAAEYYRYLTQSYVADRLFDAGQYELSAQVRGAGIRSVMNAYTGSVAYGVSAGTAGPGLVSAGRIAVSTYGPTVGTLSTLAGQEIWYRGQQAYQSAQQTYYSTVHWMSTPQGQEALRNATDFITSFIEGADPNPPSTPAGSAGFILGESYRRYQRENNR